jgi:hypothetical protein
MISSKINTLLQLLYVLAVVANAAFRTAPGGHTARDSRVADLCHAC